MPLKDRAARLAYLKRWREMHVEKRRAERPWYDRVRHANARARQYGAPGRITVAEARTILASRICHWCGRPGSVVLDHVKPLVQGGANRPENLVPACFSCNARKYTKSAPHAWSTHHDACIVCGTTTHRHDGEGRCVRCAEKIRKERKRRGAVA